MDFFDVYALITLATFYTLLMSKSLLQHKRGNPVISLGKSKNGFAKYLELFFYLGLVFLTYLVIIGAYQMKFFGVLELFVLFNTLPTRILAFVLQNTAIVLFAFALASFKDAWRIGVDYHQNQTLVTEGIFKYTRNPTYIAMNLLFISYFLLYANFFFLGSMLFIIFAFHHQIKKEEILLENVFKDDYLLYKKHTPRYFFKK